MEYRLSLEKTEIENLQKRQLNCEKNGFQSDFERLTSEKTVTESLRNRISELEAEKTTLQSDIDQIILEKVKIENLRNRISQLEVENAGLHLEKSEWSQYQKEITNKVKDLTSVNQNFRNSLDMYQSKQKTDCEKNELSQNFQAKREDKSGELSKVTWCNNYGAVIITLIT